MSLQSKIAQKLYITLQYLYIHKLNAIEYSYILYLCNTCRYRQSGNESDLFSSYLRMTKLDVYHGQASGVFGCDEHLAGTMPSRGTELCTVVESMFSYETLFGIQGNPIFGTCMFRVLGGGGRDGEQCYFFLST